MMKRRCIYLDRDGIINVKPPDGQYVCTWNDFKLQPVIIDWIRLFNALGYLVIVVTNQRGVAKGVLRLDDLEEIHSNMKSVLAANGARIDDIYYCPHQEGSCTCRKPQPGMVMAAQKKWNIDLRQSVMLGDSDLDRQLALRCGLGFVHARDGQILGVENVDDISTVSHGFTLMKEL